MEQKARLPMGIEDFEEMRTMGETGSDSTLFDGLEISGEKELCDKYMGKFPVISISLKSVEGDTFEILVIWMDGKLSQMPSQERDIVILA